MTENGDSGVFRIPLYRSPRKPTPVSSNTSAARQGISPTQLERIDVFLQSYGIPNVNGFDLKRLQHFRDSFSNEDGFDSARLDNYVRQCQTSNPSDSLINYEKFLEMYKYVFNLS